MKLKHGKLISSSLPMFVQNENKYFSYVVIGLIIFLFVSIIVCVALGPVKIPFNEVWAIAAYKIGLVPKGNWTLGNENIVWFIRFPRTLLAVVVGGGLALVGVVLQAMTRNKLADSYILGVSSGATLGAVIAFSIGIYSIFGIYGVQFAGFMGAFIAFIIVYFITLRTRLNSSGLILAGIGIGYVLSGLASFITLTSKNKQLAGQALSWTLGSLARASWFDLGLPTLIIFLSVFYLMLQARNLNLLLLGEEVATTLGLDVQKNRKKLFFLVSLITGVIVAVSGSIGFIGLMVPHIIRLRFHSNHAKVLPLAILLGANMLVWVDYIARTMFDPIEIPVGVITSIIGGPFFLLMMLKSKKRQEELV